MILIHRIEGIVRIVLIDWVGRIPGVVLVDRIERTVRIVLIDRIERIVRRILVHRSEDVVVPFVPLIEAEVGMARCGPRQEHHDQQHPGSHRRLLAVGFIAHRIPDDRDIQGPLLNYFSTGSLFRSVLREMAACHPFPFDARHDIRGH